MKVPGYLRRMVGSYFTDRVLKYDTDDGPKEYKMNSEIVENGFPYKEIEIVINDNWMVLRIQRLPFPPKEGWEPLCDCLSDPTNTQADPEPQRVITAAPNPPPLPASPLAPQPLITTKSDKFTSLRSIDVADNPNMFLLKIRKRSETSEKKRENLDLEFRTPRPWFTKPHVKRKKSFHEEYQERKENQPISEDKMPPTKKQKSRKGKKIEIQSYNEFIMER
ncbi:uncharacterized protein LOC107042695 [Diachasma alloeum]|uniref:uncharacterized protein LOC107042695 n=1 Tax=Diachasma alloeum TaxID=454923 RepID=UPI00073814C3|nr:uncharacterized protein LOC107042695 [Diachasma alloeum]